jgi:membrane fusion protein (multidrug efflux system)
VIQVKKPIGLDCVSRLSRIRKPTILISASRTSRQRIKPRLGLGRTVTAILCIAFTLSGCGGKKTKPAPPPPQVGYVVVQKSSVPMTTELGGRTSAYQTAQVRPQVTGIIRRREFVEGSIVRKGQPLYQIDPSLYKASTDQAAANLASAQASAADARIKAERYKPLAQMQAVAQQDYSDAAAAAKQANAAVKQNQAALETARINLKFTTVPAPITGKIGISAYTVGALVTASQTDPLTTIQQLDPMYVDIQESSADLLALKQSLGRGGVTPASAQVHLKLDDGSDYGFTGVVEFSEAMVDPNTGTVTLRARFPNPQGLLLPGMFVRAEFAQAINNNAILVPEAGVAHDPKGNATVLLVGPNNKVVQKTVTADRTQGAFWVVTAGLNPGDKIITEGTANAKPGAAVQPVPAGTPEKIAPPKGKDAKSGKAQASAQAGG